MSHQGRSGNFSIGSLRVHPRERLVEGNGRKLSLEPLVMRLFTGLADQAGQVVTRRDLFALCWGTATVGDDSLNRLIAALRRSLSELGSQVSIETVPGTGYVLRIGNGQTEGCRDLSIELEAASDSWRLGLPQPDYLRIEQLRAACRQAPEEPRLWGWRALLCRHAAEYGVTEEIASFTGECDVAARRALQLDPTQPEALTALATVIPLFGEWTLTRRCLEEILHIHPDHVVATQDLATLEMATGRIREGKRIRDGLMQRDPLAAVTCYKSVYQHWSVGDRQGTDRVAERAIQLWPTHPAVWLVRLWTYAYSGRPAAALAMTAGTAIRPDVPQPMLAFLRNVLECSSRMSSTATAQIVDIARAYANKGPAAAIAGLFALGLTDDLDTQFDILQAYYLRQGKSPVPTAHSSAELALNEQHRRLTQVLFTPVMLKARQDHRFIRLCEQIGLTRSWEETNLTPDFLIEG